MEEGTIILDRKVNPANGSPLIAGPGSTRGRRVLGALDVPSDYKFITESGLQALKMPSAGKQPPNMQATLTTETFAFIMQILGTFDY